MAETTVFGCDWCKEIVQKRQSDDKPMFAATVSVTAGMSLTAGVYDICASCLKVFKAVTEGKFKR